MTPRCAWLITECGQVSALPAEAEPECCCTGPVYELPLQYRAPAKLLYTHTPSANVNETASALAGHTVNGDACLVLSPSTSPGPSPAVLLDGLLRAARGPQRGAASPQTQPNPSPQPHRRRLREASTTAAVPLHPKTDFTGLDTRDAGLGIQPPYPPTGQSPPGSPTTSSSTVADAAAAFLRWGMGASLVQAGAHGSPVAEDGPSSHRPHPHPHRHRWCQGHAATAHSRHQAMRAILGSRNALPPATAMATARSQPPPLLLPQPGGPVRPSGPPNMDAVLSSVTGVADVAHDSINIKGSTQRDIDHGGNTCDSGGTSSERGSLTGVAGASLPMSWSRLARDLTEGPPCKSARTSREFEMPGRAPAQMVAAAASAAEAAPSGWQPAAAGCGAAPLARELPASLASTATPLAGQVSVVAQFAWPQADWQQGAPDSGAPREQVRALQPAAAGRDAGAEDAGMEVDDDGRGDSVLCPALTALNPLHEAGCRAIQEAETSAELRARQERAQPAGLGVIEVEVTMREVEEGRAFQAAPGAAVAFARAGADSRRGEEAAASPSAVEEEQEEEVVVEEAMEVEVPWAELASDAVACIAMQLPQRASQVQAMAAVCRGWRAAILGHNPLLRRITFGVDPARPIRPTQPAADPARPIRPAADPAPVQHPQRRTSQLERAPVKVGGASAGDAAVLDEQSVLAAAVLRQYAAGAFLLQQCCSTSAGQQARQPDGDPSQGVEAGAAAAATSAAGAAAASSGPEGRLTREAVLRAPRLLSAAAQASNPSALLVMAQLVEASGDRGGALRYWRRLAQAGDVMGMFKMGMACYDGSYGVPSDPETAHLWLGRTIRIIMRVDNLAAIRLEDGRARNAATVAAAGGGTVPALAAAAAATAAAAAGSQQQRRPTVARVSAALRAQVSALDEPRLHMLAWSAIVLGYLEFDGVAGRSVWGMGDRSEAVRMFRLAEACGLAEASTVLGWLYNTGQY